MAEPVQTETDGNYSRAIVFLGWALMLIFAFHASTHMVGAGDTWVAMACGRHFANHGVGYDSVSVEPFSANSHKPGPTAEEVEKWPGWAQWITDKVGLETVKWWHPTGWVDQNWLTHLIFYKLVPKDAYADGISFDSNALAYWKFAIYIVTIICVYYMGRLLGAHPALAAVFACFALFVGRSFLDVRPAGFSNMLVAVFLLILILTTHRNVLYIWLIVPVTVFWCNVHGGYIYVFITLVPFLAVNFATMFAPKWFVSVGKRGLWHTCGAGAAAFAASILLNPYHLTNLTHTFVISVSKHAEAWRSVNEWHSGFEWTNPVGTGHAFLALVILCGGGVVLWMVSRLLMPAQLLAPKNELAAQSRHYRVTVQVFWACFAVVAFWVAFVGFSFLNLSAADFLICVLFVGILLLSVFSNVHFIWLAGGLSVLAVLVVHPPFWQWLSEQLREPMWADAGTPTYLGRYIYAFILVPSYVVIYIVASSISKRVKGHTYDIGFVLIAGVVSWLVVMKVFNPLRIPAGEGDIERLMTAERVWRPLYEGTKALDYNWLFGSLYVTNIVAIGAWLVYVFWRMTEDETAAPNKVEAMQGQNGRKQAVEHGNYELPRVDLAIIVIAALTVYMAIRSRRFIPIAAVAACPVLAAIAQEMLRTLSAAHSFHSKGRLEASRMSDGVRELLVVAGSVAVIAFGTWWGYKFQQVFLAAWPTDTRLNNIFMRMTASDAKPFYAMKFVKDNELSGKMFNYWTEGGFIAWGQEPDPNTGGTPLKLFMDGRAQAAYDRNAYNTWQLIMAGGYIGERLNKAAEARGGKLDAEDFRKIGEWIDTQLKEQDVWVTLMPTNQRENPFLDAIEHTPNWQFVYFDNEQQIMVDTEQEKGRELFDKVLRGEARYPDDFTKQLMIARSVRTTATDTEGLIKGYNAALEAFMLRPSLVSAKELYAYSKYAELKRRAGDVFNAYFGDLLKNEKTWKKKNGHVDRLMAGMYSASYLLQAARERGDRDAAVYYSDQFNKFDAERDELMTDKRW